MARRRPAPTTGARIQELREAMGLSQADLALAADVSRPSIYAWEADTYRPNSRAIVSLAVALGTSEDYLLCYTDDPSAPRRRARQSEMAQAVRQLADARRRVDELRGR